MKLVAEENNVVFGGGVGEGRVKIVPEAYSLVV